mgnify:CR=1 FL=1
MLLVMPINVDVWGDLTRWPVFCGPLSCTLVANNDLISEDEGWTVLPIVKLEDGSVEELCKIIT